MAKYYATVLRHVRQLFGLNLNSIKMSQNVNLNIIVPSEDEFCTPKSALRQLQESNAADERKRQVDTTALSIVLSVTFSICIVVVVLSMILFLHSLKESMFWENDKAADINYKVHLPEVDLDESMNKFSQQDWVICLLELSNSTEHRMISSWSHIFHSKWIEDYLNAV